MLNKKEIKFVCILIVVLLVFIGCFEDDEHYVEYHVLGSNIGTVNIEYTNSCKYIVKMENQNLPFHQIVDNDDFNAWLNVENNTDAAVMLIINSADSHHYFFVESGNSGQLSVSRL